MDLYRGGIKGGESVRLVIYLFVLILIVSGCDKDNSLHEIVYVNEHKESRMKQIRHDVQTKPYTIALVPRLTGDSYYDAAEEGAKEAAEKFGVNLIFRGSPVADYNEQIKVIKNLITKKVDAIAVAANDPFKLLPVLNEARAQGIKVITWDSDTDPTGRDLFVNTVDPQTLGIHLMDDLAARLNEKGEFAIITNNLSTANTNEWIKWMKIQQTEYYPDMELVRIMPSNDSYENAYQDAKYLLENYPDLSAIVGVSPEALPAVAQAITEARKSDVDLSGLALPNLMRNYINDGVAQNIILWSPQKLGYLTVTLAKNLLDGQFPVDQQDIPDVGNIRVKDNVVIMGETIMFTKENIDQYDF